MQAGVSISDVSRGCRIGQAMVVGAYGTSAIALVGHKESYRQQMAEESDCKTVKEKG